MTRERYEVREKKCSKKVCSPARNSSQTPLKRKSSPFHHSPFNGAEDTSDTMIFFVTSAEAKGIEGHGDYGQ